MELVCDWVEVMISIVRQEWINKTAKAESPIVYDTDKRRWVYKGLVIGVKNEKTTKYESGANESIGDGR